MKRIPFNKPYLTGKELVYIKEAVESGKISGNGIFTKKCHLFFNERYEFNKCLLTTSCTDALEMAAILLNIKEGDEVILPSYTFVSTANAFVLRGARLVFADSRKDHPGIDESKLESLITSKTKAIIVVHYAGVASDMDQIMDIAKLYNLSVVEDAAQAIDSYYIDRKGVKRPLGSIGHLAAFSFHETKNIISGEGGMLVINDKQFEPRSEIIWEKGTNRSAFFRGEIDKYGWVDIGSSFLPSDINAAFLYAQLENIEKIQTKRKRLWECYYNGISNFNTQLFELPNIPNYATVNAHMFYLVFKNSQIRTEFIDFLNLNHVQAVFHYLSLHKSMFFSDKYQGDELKNCDQYNNGLVRLPFYYELQIDQAEEIVSLIGQFIDHYK